MTAIQTRQTPEQRRREEARAHAEATQVLLPQPLFPLVLAVLYVALLVVPWALTCNIASQPSFLVRYNRTYTGYDVRHGWVLAIKILNSLATALSLPILSALLARAAVVFSQRRKPGQTLTLRQLFALADRDWYNLVKVISPLASSSLLRLGFLVLLIAIVLPLVRSGLLAYDSVPVVPYLSNQYHSYHNRPLGYTPSPVALKTAYLTDHGLVIADTRNSLQTTHGGIEPNLWPVCNDGRPESTCGFTYGPYDLAQSALSNFWEDPEMYSSAAYRSNDSALMHASTLGAGSSIGSYHNNKHGAYALGLKSGTMCELVSAQEVEEQCLRSTDNGPLPLAARGWNTRLAIEGQLQLEICYPELERSPWETADASPWKPINITEHLYVSLRDEVSSGDCGMVSDTCGSMGVAGGLYIHCQAESVMSYFEIGSDRTKGAPTRFLDEMPAGFDIPRGDSASGSPTPDDDQADHLGPLKTAAMAMFGNDSWLDTLGLALAGVESANTSLTAALMLLCQTRPLGNADVFGGRITCDKVQYIREYPGLRTASEWFSDLVREFFTSFRYRKLARATLNTATFYANKALLSRMIGTRDWDTRKYSSEESDERMTIPVLSAAATATVSVFIALQVACIIILLFYIYRGRVWTLTLDSLAVARIGAQLSALDVFLGPRETGTLGTARLGPRASKQLDQADGLVGSTTLTGQNDIEMATIPPPYAPRGEEPSTREEQRVLPPGGEARGGAAEHDRLAPLYSPPADGSTARAASGGAGAAGGDGEAAGVAISHAASSGSRDPVLPGMPSLPAVAVGARGLITRRMWRQADKPLPARPGN